MLSHFKRRLGALAALAVLAAMVPTVTSTPAASAAPATTAITAATIGGSLARTADYLACPTGAASAAGFTDTTSTAVDCLAMFGITKGTTATTYSPDDSVPRWAMALYITRAHAPAGGTLGAGVDQGFTDISGKSAEIQLAINQIAELGITVGKTATTFAPDDNVTREEMAMFIERWLGKVLVGPGGNSDAEGVVTAALTTYVHSAGASTDAYTGLYNYTDIDAGAVTVEGSNAIKELYDLGIHDGVAATTYNPASDMTRAAMATFMELALNHTNARPAGLTIQASAYTNAGAFSPTLTVSDRTAAFAAVADTPVDVFYWRTSATEGNAAFLATGLCDNSLATASSITKCYIDTGEPQTNAKGNMTPTVAGNVIPLATIYPGSDVFYAWTAAAATTFDNDLHGETANALDHDTITVGATAGAAQITCTMDTPANTLVSTAAHTVAFGVTTTVTCQAQSAAGAGNVSKALQYVKYENTRVFTTDSTSAQSGTIAEYEEYKYTGATGEVTFVITGPTDTLGTDVVTDSVTITCVTIAVCTNGTAVSPLTSTSGFMSDGGASLTFSLAYTDTAAATATVALASTATSGTAATTGVTRTYTATAYDQYGATVTGEVGTFSSSSTLPGGLACSVATPSVCTTRAVHGLAVGDDVIFDGLGAWVGSDGTTNTVVNSAIAGATPTTGSGYTVGTVPSTTTFTLLGASGNSMRGILINLVTEGTASTDASPIVAVATSVASASRTTTTDGTASYSWSDTEGTSGKDTVTFNPATASVSNATKAYYRLASSTSSATAGDFTSTDASGDDATDSETYAKLVEWDGTNNDFIIEITDDTDASNSVLSYQQYTFDSNDHFAKEGVVSAALVLNGTASTMAAFETAMGTAALTTGGSANDIVFIDYGTGLSTDINRFTMDAG